MAIRRIIAEIEQRKLSLIAGRVTFIPEANPLAFAQGTRATDRDLNRDLRSYTNPSCYEDLVANRLCAELDQHDVLLDLHSFTSDGDPFVFVGPENNSGALEPFEFADKELRFAMSLELDRMVFGWFRAFREFVEIQNSFLSQITPGPTVALPFAVNSGRGTTEYIRSAGGYGVTVECGSHGAPDAPLVAYRTVLNALSSLGITGELRGGPQPFLQALRVTRIYMKEALEDSLLVEAKPFSAVVADQPLARRRVGTIVRAPSDGCVIFAHPNALIGEDWIHFGIESSRGVSSSAS